METVRYQFITLCGESVPFHLQNLECLNKETQLYQIKAKGRTCIDSNASVEALQAVADYIVGKNIYEFHQNVDPYEFRDVMRDILNIEMKQDWPFTYWLAWLRDQAFAGRSPALRYKPRFVAHNFWMKTRVSDLAPSATLSNLGGSWKSSTLRPYGPQVLASLLGQSTDVWMFKTNDAPGWVAETLTYSQDRHFKSACYGHIAVLNEILDVENTCILNYSRSGDTTCILFNDNILDVYRCQPCEGNKFIAHSATFLWSWYNQTVVISSPPQKVGDFYMTYHIPNDFNVCVTDRNVGSFIDADEEPDMRDMSKDYMAVHMAANQPGFFSKLFSCWS